MDYKLYESGLAVFCVWYSSKANGVRVCDGDPRLWSCSYDNYCHHHNRAERMACIESSEGSEICSYKEGLDSKNKVMVEAWDWHSGHTDSCQALPQASPVARSKSLHLPVPQLPTWKRREVTSPFTCLIYLHCQLSRHSSLLARAKCNDGNVSVLFSIKDSLLEFIFVPFEMSVLSTNNIRTSNHSNYKIRDRNYT